MNADEIVESERIKPLILLGKAKTVDAKLCERFNDYLCEYYPWYGFSDRIDWANVKSPYKRFKWNEATSEESTNFLKSTCLSRYDEVCIMYGAKARGLLVTFDFLCEHLEQLVIFGWHTRFLVGTKRNKYGILNLVHESFVEADFADWLTASC